MSVGGNDKLYIKAMICAGVEGSVALSLVDITVEIIALK